MIDMDASSLRKLIALGEGSTVELKQSVPKDTGQTICAFANSDGGHLILGVDRKGQVTGLGGRNLDQLQQEIFKSYKICDPLPGMQIHTVDVEGKPVLVVTTAKLGEGVCYYGNEIYLRVGSTNHRLAGPEIEDFLRKTQLFNFDHSKSTASIGDVDPEKVKSFMERRTPNYVFETKNLKKLLLSLRVAVENGGFYLRNGGILFFAKEPAHFFPQNQVKLARFKGKTAVDVLDTQVLSNTVIENIDQSIAFINRSTKKAYEITGGPDRIERTEYPETAVREAIVNSLAHRDYFSTAAVQVNIFDDRIEFVNPGVLPKGMSTKTLPSLGLGVPRNPLVYQLLIDAKKVEGIGTGIPRMIDAMRKHGLPDPEFQQIGPFFKTTLYNAFDEQGLGLNIRQRRCLIYLKDNEIITGPQYRQLFKTSHPTAVADLNKLIKAGLVKKRGKGKATAYVLAKRTIH